MLYELVWCGEVILYSQIVNYVCGRGICEVTTPTDTPTHLVEGGTGEPFQ